MFSCNLSPALLAQWPGSFTCYCGNTGEERIPKWVSIESWPWRIKFSRRSCRDSNTWPFDHKSGALTTELCPYMSVCFSATPSLSVSESLSLCLPLSLSIFYPCVFSLSLCHGSFAHSLSCTMFIYFPVCIMHHYHMNVGKLESWVD